MRRIVLLALILFAFSCGANMAISTNNGDIEKTKRAAMCKELCDKKHYNIRFIWADGKMEEIKINIVSIEDKIACECRF